MSGVLKVAHQPTKRAKDGNPENGVELDVKIYQFEGDVLPWQMPPCPERIAPLDGTTDKARTDQGKNPKPTVIVLRLEGPGPQDDFFFIRTTLRLFGFLQHAAKVKTAFNTSDFLELLNNDEPQAIMIADHVLTIRDANQRGYNPACNIIMEKIKNFVSEGGYAVFCGDFNSARYTDVAPFWRTHFDRPWVWLAWHRAVIDYQPAAVEYFPPNNFLKKWYNCKNHFLGHVDPTEALYIDPDRSDLAGITYAKLGKGHFGWVGDGNLELATDECVYAMCGFSYLDPRLDKWYPDTSVTARLGANGFEFAA